MIAGILLTMRLIDRSIRPMFAEGFKAEVQVRQMKEYEPDLEDIFLLIMERLGTNIKGSSELMTPEHTGGA